jgi:hypothetical protein
VVIARVVVKWKVVHFVADKVVLVLDKVVGKVVASKLVVVGIVVV